MICTSKNKEEKAVCKYNQNCINGLVNVDGNYIKCECIRDRKIEHFFNWSDAERKHFKRLADLKDQETISGKGRRFSYKNVIEQLTNNPDNIKHLVEDEFRLVLSGGTGSGKTQMAVTTAIEVLANFDLQDLEVFPRKFYFLPVVDIKNYQFDKDKTKLNEIRDKVKKSDVLILDDLGTEIQIKNESIPYIHDALNTIIRSFNGFLIITTNLNNNINETYKNYNKRLASVLTQGSEDEHGEYNNLFYNVLAPGNKERRKKKNINVAFL
jgi:DNA replication protein DnaC